MQCRVCKFELKFLKNIQGEVSRDLVPLYKCKNCYSYFSCMDLTCQEIDKLPTGEIDGYLNNEKDVKIRINNLISRFSDDLYNGKSKKYLDIGCGVGWSLKIAGEYGYEAFGVEPEVQAVNFAKSKLSLNVVNSYFSSDLFEHESFDLIVMDQVLEHSPNPEDLLVDAFKLLKPGGIFFLGVPPVDWTRKAVSMSLHFSSNMVNKIYNINYLKNIIPILKKYDSFITPEGHINNFTAQSIKILAQACNAEVISELHNNIARVKYYKYLGITTGSFILRKELGEFK